MRCDKKRRGSPQWLFAAIALCLAVPAITTCDNSSDSSTAILMAQMAAAQQQQQQQQQVQQSAPQPAAPAAYQAAKIVTFTGSVLGSYGAMPAKAAALVCPELALDISQSASPDLSGSGYEWFANATSGGVTVEGNFVSGSANRTFEIPLEVGKTWNITCGIRVAGGGAPVMADTYPFNATEENTILSRAFIPEPVSDGNGSMELKMTLDSSSNAAKVTAFCVSDDWPVNETTGSKEWPLAIDGTTATLSVPGLKRGIYDVSFNFFATSDATGDVFLYTTVQTVNVLANAKTDTWALGGGEGTVTDGKLVINAALIAASAPTVLYVGDTGAPGAKAQSDSNAGGAYAPLASLSKAAQIIEATASGGSKNYKVYVKGAIDSDQTASFSSSLDGKAKSITIAGLSQTASGAEPSDKISGGKYPHGAITVQTKVPVTIKNLAISESYGDKGGAIYAKGSGVKVTLENGALIKKCHASYGGGVCVEDGATLVINEGAKLVENYTNVEATSDDADTYGGFAVYASGTGATVTMNGGEISQNKGSKGNRGAVKIASGAVFNFNDGKIADNNTQKIAANVYINSGVMNMKGGEISGGKALKNDAAVAGAQGGGVYLAGTGKLDMSGGKIENNDFSANENSLGGGIYVGKSAQVILSGGASVPCATDSSGNLLQKNNDVYLEKTSGSAYSPIQVATGFSPSVSGKIGVTADSWIRKQVVVKSSSGASITGCQNFFGFTASGVTMSFGGSDNTVAKLIAPYYVADNGEDLDTCAGTETDPFRTIGYAVSRLSGGDKEVLNIKGRLTPPSDFDNDTEAVTSPQLIPDTFTTDNCAGLTIQGVGDSSSIDRNLPASAKTGSAGKISGCALAVESTVPITIKNIKITGGYSKRGGAGIRISKSGASVCLDDGVQITGNCFKDQSGWPPAHDHGGGGVFVGEGAKLFVCGTALIGDKTESIPGAKDAGANYCDGPTVDDGSGGGIHNRGSVYMGYSGMSGTTLKEKAVAADCGVRRNSCAGLGGGIYNADGATLKMASGQISCNFTSYGCSGAVYNEGTFYISGTANIPYGDAEGKNDVCLHYNKYVTIDENGFAADAPATVATIKPYEWKRGDTVLAEAKAGLVAGSIGRFKTCDDDFKINLNSNAGILKADIYLASTGTDTTRIGNPGIDGSSARGTRAKPYATMAQALPELSTDNNTITIDGKVSGASSIKTVPSGVAAIALKGRKSAGAATSNASLDGNSAGSTLTVDRSSLTVTIQDLAITGGTGTEISDPDDSSKKYNVGGGIYLKAGTVKLGNGSKITGNSVYGNGGGVYVAKDAKLYMSGTALIGDAVTGADATAVATNGGCANKASVKFSGGSSGVGGYGGGIYNLGSVYLGTSESALTAEYGVRRNYAQDSGGGICNGKPTATTFALAEINGGAVSYNGAGSNGGGLYGDFVLDGGSVVGNKSNVNGGGVFVTSTTAQIKSGTMQSNAAMKGGAAYISSGAKLAVSGGYFKGNSAIRENATEGQGGAIYIDSTAILAMSAGTIGGNGSSDPNTASDQGGAIYQAGTFSISGGAVVYAGSEKSNDVYLPDGKYVNVADSITSSAATVATISPYEYNRGRKILTTNSSSLDLDGVKTKFAVAQDNSDWDKEKVTESSTSYVSINSPIYVVGTEASGSTRPDTTNWDWGLTSDATGTKSKPYASIAAASNAGDLAVATEPNTITVAGTLKGIQTISGKSVTIKGYGSSSAIDGNSAGSALTVDASGKTVTIQDLTITGGSAENGGGVNIAAGTVKLGGGAKIYGNKATANGGGVYLAGSDSTLFMFGAAIIGEDKTGYPNDADHASNSAENGGGIYNNGGNLYLGYTGMSGSNPVPASDAFTGGVRRNYAKSYGGIQCEKGINKIRDGNISNNAAQQKGGALGFTNTGGTYSIMGGTFATNYAPSGGAIYVPTATSLVSVTISAGTFDSNVASNGGALWLSTSGKVTVSGSTLFKGNTAGIKGGAVCNEGVFEMTGGTIGGDGVQNKATTTTALGGAIYQNGTFYVSGNALVYAGSERVNDVYLAAEKTVSIASKTLNGGDTVATITPNSWTRGRQILGVSGVTVTDAQLTSLGQKFGLSEAGWDKENISTTGVKINSPIYVASTATSDTTRIVCKAGLSAGANGTTEKPYATIAAALGASDLGVAGNKITVDGTVIGAQSIASTSSDITLTGYVKSGETSSAATIKRYSTTPASAATDGSTLTVNTTKSVTITNLTITGGTGTSMTVGTQSQVNGGGICLKAGTVKLGNGVVIAGNSVANNGGGVYVYSTATLYMSGTAIIGDTNAYTASSSTVNLSPTSTNVGCANKASHGGGIFNQNGNVYIGCDSSGNSTGTSASYALATGYGVRRNYATDLGGGVCHNVGTIKFGSGCVSYNYALQGGAVYCGENVNFYGGTMESNKAQKGGAIYNSTGKVVTISGALALKNNEATNNGGGIYNSGTLTMNAGSFSGNKATGASGQGGAVYQGGTLNISGGADIPKGSAEKDNDIYLPEDKYITLGGNLSTTNYIAITPGDWTRGKQVLSGSSYISSNYSKFKVTDTDWSVVSHLASSTYTGRIDADLYVAPTSSTTTVSGTTYGKGAASTDGGRGTKAKPYSTIADAVAQCWGGPKDTGTGVSRVINIVGTITGAQEIANTVTTAKASGITLEGVNTSATLNGGMSSTSATKKSTLTISTAVPVTIKTLTVKGGYSSGNGGGILVNGVKGASLTLGVNAVITGNTATTSGGGIYFAGTSASSGTANLIMNSTSQISGNTANGTATTNGGGGVYLSYANLSMSGSALIGDTSGSTYATSASTGHSNMAAKNGGGVYLAAGGKLRLGYASAGATSGTSLSSTYGIRHNYASACGGGVYAVGSVDFASGAVSCNGTAGTSDCDGGGIWFGSASTLTMAGGTIANNKGYYGGGVYAGGTLSMSGGTIGDSSKTSAATSSSGFYSNSASYGGGIYAPSGSTLTLNGGYVSYNYASTSGGGIYSVTSNAVTFKANANFNRAGSNGGGMYIKNQISMTGGVIKGNCAVNNGGGIYMDGGNLYMSGSAVIGDSSKSDYATSANACSNYALNNGGGIYLGDESYACLGYTDYSTPINSFTGGIYYNYAKNNGGGICDNPDYGNDVKYNGGSISFNGTSSSGFGGAVYLSGNSSTLTFRGSNTKIVAGTYSYYNTVYLNSAKVGVDASNKPTSTTIATIIPSSYSETTQVMGSDSAALSSSQFTVLPNSSNTWSISPSTGKLQKTNVMTNTSLASFSPTSGTKYNFVIPANVEQDNLSKFLDKLFNHNDTPSMGAGSSMDFSKVTSHIRFDSSIVGGGSDRRTNNITTIIVPGGSGDLYFDYSTDNALTSVKEYIVPADSENYTSVDGVLYNKDMTELIKYPAKKTNTAFTIPDSVQTVARSAFYGAIYLQQISIPTSVTRLDETAFYGAGLISVTIPGNADILSSGYIFQNCSDLTSVTINSGVKYIGTEYQAEVFKDCKKLKTVSIPSSVIRIGRSSFENCFSYSSSYSGTITVPSGVTFLGRGVFSGCTYLSLSFNCSKSGWTYGDGPDSGSSVPSSYFTTTTFVNGSYKLVRN